MRTPLSLSAALVVALPLVGCDKPSQPQADGSGPTVRITSPKMDQVIEVPDGRDTTVDASPEALAKIEDPTKREETKQRALPIDLMLDVQSYALTGKADAGGNGQHIHVIVDNEPYDAVYDATKAVRLKPSRMTPGTHVIRAFPSAGPKDEKGAAHHESRKNPGAFAWVRFHVKSKDGPLADFDGTKPLLTYSRPKGDYKVGSPELRKFLVDFYLSPGVRLGKGFQSVHAILDGKPLTSDGKPLPDFVEWKPYFIDSPAVGEHTLTLDLLDESGKKVDGPFNSTTRKFKVVD